MRQFRTTGDCWPRKCSGHKWQTLAAHEDQVQALVRAQSDDHVALANADGNAAVFIAFPRRLIRGAEREIFVIVDRGSAHRAKKAGAFGQPLGGKLRLFFLPPYAPGRNPDELVGKHQKADTVGRMAMSGQGRFREEGSPLEARSAK